MFLQTDSKHKSVRGWGCVYCTLCKMAGMETIEQVDAAFPILVKNGLVLDNDRWYAFCGRPLQGQIVEALAETIGKKVVARELTVHPHDPEPTSNLKGIYILVRGETESGGDHFGLSYPEEYNPDPRYPLDNIKEWRVWAVANA